jgi:photosystem II stability/assembly factor-like uncharacterized protein
MTSAWNKHLSILRPGLAMAAAAVAACAPTPAPAPSLMPSALPSNTPAPTETPTATPSPTLGATPRPWPKPPTQRPTARRLTITGIRMIDSMTGWAEGQVGPDDSRILRTDDGGLTWRDISPAPGADYRGSFFLDEQQAWVFDWFGGPAWRTADGGGSWQLMESSPWRQDEVWFNDGQHGWLVGGEAFGMSFPGYDIYSFAVTQDGGQTWKERTPPPGGGFPFLAFPDERNAWVIWAAKRAAMEGWADLGVPIRVLTTSDGGRTWISRLLPLPAETYTIEIEYEGSYLGGGGNCTFVSPVYSSTAIWKAALTCEYSSWMYTSANQGKTWIISPMPPGTEADVQFINPTVGWLFVWSWEERQGNLYHSADGGQSWTLIKRTGWFDVVFNFIDDQTGWAVACTETRCHNFDAVYALVKTTDGGRTWQTLEPHLAP